MMKTSGSIESTIRTEKGEVGVGGDGGGVAMMIVVIIMNTHFKAQDKYINGFII